MKKYIKPNVKVVAIKFQPLLHRVSGLQGVTVSDSDFKGGSADSRRGGSWDDEEEW